MDKRDILIKELETIESMIAEIDGNIELLEAQKQRINVIAEAIGLRLQTMPEQLEFELVDN
jgi:hypothetical protein